MKGHTEVIEVLLKAGANLEARDPKFFDQDQPEEPPKRRWSLFRKGGDR